MDAADAAAIASICGAIVGIVTVGGQVFLARQARATHKMVNGMAARRKRTDRAEGAKLALSGEPHVGVPTAAPTATATAELAEQPVRSK